MILQTANDFEDSVELESLLRHVIPIVPELPHGMALDLLRQKYTYFCRRSSLLVAKLEVYFQKDVRDYQLEAPEGYEIHILLKAGLDEDSMEFISSMQDGYGRRFYVENSRNIRLNFTPGYDYESPLIIYASVLPNECVGAIPRDVSVAYGAEIADGVIAAALRIPNKSWTDKNLSRLYDLNYNRGVLSARQLAEGNRKAGPRRVKPVRVV